MTHLKKAALICENYRRELEMVVKSEGVDDLEIVTFPANCHKSYREKCSFTYHPLNLAGKGYDSIHVFGCSCVSGVECKHLTSGTCVHHREKLCFNMLAERNLVASFLEDGAYLLSPGWLEKWKTYLADWRMERGVAVEFFAESARKLVLLDTLVDPASGYNLAEFADFGYEADRVGLF